MISFSFVTMCEFWVCMLKHHFWSIFWAIHVNMMKVINCLGCAFKAKPYASFQLKVKLKKLYFSCVKWSVKGDSWPQLFLLIFLKKLLVWIIQDPLTRPLTWLKWTSCWNTMDTFIHSQPFFLIILIVFFTNDPSSAKMVARFT